MAVYIKLPVFTNNTYIKETESKHRLIGRLFANAATQAIDIALVINPFNYEVPIEFYCDSKIYQNSLELNNFKSSCKSSFMQVQTCHVTMQPGLFVNTAVHLQTHKHIIYGLLYILFETNSRHSQDSK